MALLAFSQAPQRLSVSTPQQVTVKRGVPSKQTLQVIVQPGYHVNSDKPRDEFLIPLKLEWVSGPVHANAISYPKGEELQVGGNNLVVYTGTFPVVTIFEANAGATPGPAVITGKLHYQACNNQMCFRPSTLNISLPIDIQ